MHTFHLTEVKVAYLYGDGSSRDPASRQYEVQIPLVFAGKIARPPSYTNKSQQRRM